MAIIYKKVRRENTSKPEAAALYYPTLLTMGNRLDLRALSSQIKNQSSLSTGEIHSVLINFVEVMRTNLLRGYSVNIENFGIFSLSAKSEGALTLADCTDKNIKSLRINFRASSTVRPSLDATSRAENGIKFVDLVTYAKSLKLLGITVDPSLLDEEDPDNSGGGGGPIFPGND